MDCLEFRRLLGSDPRITRTDAREHLDGCPFCADAYARALAFDGRLAHALAVPVPARLADRILLAQLTGERQRQRVGRRRMTWIAVAAAASLVIAIGLVEQQRATARTLPSMVAAHVMAPDEHSALGLRVTIPDQSVSHAFADRGVPLRSVPAGIVYVSECDIGEYRTVHMVMPEDGQPVSVVYVTGRRAAATGDFRREGMAGREVPLGNGTLVMLAQNADHFGALEQRWRGALEGTGAVAGGSL